MGRTQRVLSCLEKAGLTANPDKCCWGGTAMEFLSHKVGNVQLLANDTAVLSPATSKLAPSKVVWTEEME